MEIHNLRFPGGIGDGGDAGGAAGRQHQVFRGSHGGEAQHNLPAPKPGGLAVQDAAGVVDFRPQVPKAGEVQVDGPGAQLTAAGIAQLRLSAPGQDGPQENGGGPHLPHQRLGNRPAAEAPGVHDQNVFPLPAGRAAQALQNADGGVHVPQAGTAPQLHLVRRQQRGRQNGQDAVLCPLYSGLAPQAAAASYD